MNNNSGAVFQAKAVAQTAASEASQKLEAAKQDAKEERSKLNVDIQSLETEVDTLSDRIAELVEENTNKESQLITAQV